MQILSLYKALFFDYGHSVRKKEGVLQLILNQEITLLFICLCKTLVFAWFGIHFATLLLLKLKTLLVRETFSLSK